MAEEWRITLEDAGILGKYLKIPTFLTHGADAGIGRLFSMFMPPNHPSIVLNQSIFTEIVNTEFKKGHYWRPYLKKELENIIGLFQTSPLSLIPKPGKPGKFCLIQNLSLPCNMINNICSINASIKTDLYPYTWGTFTTVASMVPPPPGPLACTEMYPKCTESFP